jgi:ribosomal-protein-alanine N-acetyltransferase
MSTDTIFSTERLSCRRWQRGDIDRIYEVYADEEGARWVDDGLPIRYEDCERWMDVTLANYSRVGYGMFAVAHQATAETIGFCGLVHPGGQLEAEVKYAFLKRHWGKGYASEIVPAMLSYGASRHGLERIMATVARENAASRRVLIKSGMKCLGIVGGEGSGTLGYAWTRKP